MHDEQQHHHPIAEDRRNAQGYKTAAVAALELQAGKQCLEDNQSENEVSCWPSKFSAGSQ